MTAAVKRRMTGEGRREQIVKIAERLFAKDGFRGTTTRSIAAEAGVSEAVIFRHFARKEDLYRAIIDARCSDSCGVPVVINAIKGKKGKAMFKALALFFMERHSKDPSFMRLLAFSALEKQNLSELFIKTTGIEICEFMSRRIMEMMREGVIRKVDPMVTARAYMGMVLHYTFSQEIYGLKRYHKWPNGLVAGIFADVFFEGLKKR